MVPSFHGIQSHASRHTSPTGFVGPLNSYQVISSDQDTADVRQKSCRWKTLEIFAEKKKIHFLETRVMFSSIAENIETFEESN